MWARTVLCPADSRHLRTVPNWTDKWRNTVSNGDDGLFRPSLCGGFRSLSSLPSITLGCCFSKQCIHKVSKKIKWKMLTKKHHVSDVKSGYSICKISNTIVFCHFLYFESQNSACGWHSSLKWVWGVTLVLWYLPRGIVTNGAQKSNTDLVILLGVLETCKC